MGAMAIIPSRRERRTAIEYERRRILHAELPSLVADALNAIHRGASERYVHYRLKGYSAASSLRYARAWARNSTEQAARRANHMTGYERGGWT